MSISSWFGESSLYRTTSYRKPSPIWRRKISAIWKTGPLVQDVTILGDEKDRVLKKQDGSLIYSPDIAYHKDKLGRGFGVSIYWGADHHGYVRVGLGRLFPCTTDSACFLRDGKPVSMSTRSGEFVSP